jgi:hypothetical protein
MSKDTTTELLGVKKTDKKLKDPRFEGSNFLGPGPGRPKGKPNKFNGELRAAILSGFNGAHRNGLAAWVLQQAQENPTAALSLLGRLIPAHRDVEADVSHTVTVKFEPPLRDGEDLASQVRSGGPR